MSEKTLGEVESWQVQVVADGEPVLTIGDNFLSGVDNVDDYSDLIRKCADHLYGFIGQAAPLLARIAELEGERDRAKCALENSKAAHKSLADDAMRALAGKVCTPEEGYVKATHCLRGDIGALEQAAYQRGVCEGMERAARITEDSHIAHSKGCECRECVPLSDAAECIRDAIRSASPAVDVTSDKGGKR